MFKLYYQHLQTIAHSDHYTKRYVRFILNCINLNKSCETLDVYEHHHILPKCYFPQFSDLKVHSWNDAQLTPRQHVIAHWILAKAVGGKMWYALKCMFNMEAPGQNRKMYISKRAKRSFKTNYSLTDETKAKISKTKKGRCLSPEHREKIRQAGLGRIVSQETRDLKRLQMLGNIHSQETKDKIRKTLSLKSQGADNVNAKRWILIDYNTSQFYLSHGEIQKLCLDLGIRFNTVYERMRKGKGRVLRGSCSGWELIRACDITDPESYALEKIHS